MGESWTDPVTTGPGLRHLAHRLERAPPLHPQGKATGRPGRPGRLPPPGNTPPHAPKGGQPAGLCLPGPPHDSPWRSPARRSCIGPGPSRTPRGRRLHACTKPQDPSHDGGKPTKRKPGTQLHNRNDRQEPLPLQTIEEKLGSCPPSFVWNRFGNNRRPSTRSTGWQPGQLRERDAKVARAQSTRTGRGRGWGAKSERTYCQACLPRHDARSLRPAGGIHTYPVCTEAFARPTHLHHPAGFNHTALPRGCVPPNGSSCGSTSGPGSGSAHSKDGEGGGASSCKGLTPGSTGGHVFSLTSNKKQPST